MMVMKSFHSFSVMCGNCVEGGEFVYVAWVRVDESGHVLNFRLRLLLNFLSPRARFPSYLCWVCWNFLIIFKYIFSFPHRKITFYEIHISNIDMSARERWERRLKSNMEKYNVTRHEQKLWFVVKMSLKIDRLGLERWDRLDAAGDKRWRRRHFRARRFNTWADWLHDRLLNALADFWA